MVDLGTEIKVVSTTGPFVRSKPLAESVALRVARIGCRGDGLQAGSESAGCWSHRASGLAPLVRRGRFIL